MLGCGAAACAGAPAADRASEGGKAMATRTSSPELLARLREIASRYRVYYLVRSDWLLVDGRVRRVGIDLSLCGTEDHLGLHLVPGCAECRHAYAELAEVVRWALPEDGGDSRLEIEPFDRSLHVVPSQRGRRNVVVDVRILHRHGFEDPVDDSQEQCFREMVAKLGTLGIRASFWDDPKTAVAS
jgi:hypothetical protein